MATAWYPPIDLLGTTYLAIHWGWLLVTLGNFTVYVVLAVVFVIGATVRLPRCPSFSPRRIRPRGARLLEPVKDPRH